MFHGYPCHPSLQPHRYDVANYLKLAVIVKNHRKCRLFEFNGEAFCITKPIGGLLAELVSRLQKRFRPTWIRLHYICYQAAKLARNVKCDCQRGYERNGYEDPENHPTVKCSWNLRRKLAPQANGNYPQNMSLQGPRTQPIREPTAYIQQTVVCLSSVLS